jgi:hypothetical protein
MPAANVMDPTKVINGSYGEAYEILDPEGAATESFLANISGVEARIAVDRMDVPRSGTRRMGYKRGNITITGTMTGYKVTSRWVERFASEADTETAPAPIVFEIWLDDPESLGTEKVRLTGVQFWEVPIGFSVGDMVEEDIPFTATGVEVMESVTGVFTEV